MMRRTAALFLGLSLSLALAAGHVAHSESGQVRLVVPWPAGGSADFVGRVLASELSVREGRTIYVDNRPGASGMIGSALVAKADPDGGTLVISGIPSHVIAPEMAETPSFDASEDFTPIAFIGGSPLVLVAHRSLGVATIPDLIRLAQASGEPLQYVSPGRGSLGNLFAELFARNTKIQLAHVPYKGGTQAISDLIAGRVKLGALTWSEARAHVTDGVLIPLAISSAHRIAGFEALPTFRDLGHDELTSTVWWALSGPAHLPTDLVTRLNRDVNDALASPAVAAKLAQQTIETQPMSAEQFAQFYVSEIERWGPIARNLKTQTSSP